MQGYATRPEIKKCLDFFKAIGEIYRIRIDLYQ